MLSLDDLVIAGDFLLRRRNPLTTLDVLDAYLSAKRGRAGYRSAMRARTLMRANSGSLKETELRFLLIRHGLPEPGINIPIFDETGSWIPEPGRRHRRTTSARPPIRREWPLSAGLSGRSWRLGGSRSLEAAGYSPE